MVFAAACRLSLIAVSRGYSLVVVLGLLVAVAFSCCCGLLLLRYLGSRVQASVVDLRHVGSSQTTD